MKRFAGLLAMIIVLILFSTTAYAFTMPDIGGIIKGASIGALALVLTGLIGLFGLATRAKWFSGVLLALGAFVHSIAAVLDYFGLILQDSKIDNEELKGIPKVAKNVKAQWKAAWAMIRGNPNG